MKFIGVAVSVMVVVLGSTRLAHAEDRGGQPVTMEGLAASAGPVLTLASLDSSFAPAGALAPTESDVVKPAAEEKLGALLVPGWTLRPAMPGTALRLDTTAAPSTMKGHTAVDTVTFLSGSYKLLPNFAVGGKFGVNHYDPAVGPSQTGNTNLLLNAQYGAPIGSYLHVAGVLGVSAPVGSGGGNSPDPSMLAAQAAGRYARAGMDNTIFSSNYLGFLGGADVAFHYRRFTAQAEASLSPLVRAKGELRSPDPEILAAGAGVMAGYFVLPRLSASAEARYSTTLSNPIGIQKDPSARDNLSFAAGLRGYVGLTETISFRPGVAYGAGIYGKVADLHYQFVQVDFPFVF